MIKTKEELLSQVREVIGESIETDAGISLIENISDTYADFEDKEKEDWRTKYEEMREKYTKRFFDSDGKEETPDPKDPNEKPKPKTFEELFKTE